MGRPQNDISQSSPRNVGAQTVNLGMFPFRVVANEIWIPGSLLKKVNTLVVIITGKGGEPDI